MKPATVLILLLMFGYSTMAQTPSWPWERHQIQLVHTRQDSSRTIAQAAQLEAETAATNLKLTPQQKGKTYNAFLAYRTADSLRGSNPSAGYDEFFAQKKLLDDRLKNIFTEEQYTNYHTAKVFDY